MNQVFFPNSGRGHVQFDWLDTHHSFSFGHWYNPKQMGFGHFRVMNEDIVDPGQGFGKHSHRDMEIITIPLSGQLQHQDSLGNLGLITPGEVQVMSAGFGIVHSEVNPSTTEPVHLYQLWILTNKPGVPPRYDQKKFETVANNSWQLVVSPDSRQESLMIYQDGFISRGKFDPGKAFYQPHIDNNAIYLHLVSGQLEIGGQILQAGDALGIKQDLAKEVEIKVLVESQVLAVETPQLDFDES